MKRITLCIALLALAGGPAARAQAPAPSAPADAGTRMVSAVPRAYASEPVRVDIPPKKLSE